MNFNVYSMYVYWHFLKLVFSQTKGQCAASESDLEMCHVADDCGALLDSLSQLFRGKLQSRSKNCSTPSHFETMSSAYLFQLWKDLHKILTVTYNL